MCALHRRCLTSWERMCVSLVLRSHNLTAVPCKTYASLRCVPTKKFLSASRIIHPAPVYTSQQIFPFSSLDKGGTSQTGWRGNKSSDVFAYKAAVLIGSILVGGIVIKSKFGLVSAEESNENSEVEHAETQSKEVEGNKAFYTGGKLSYTEAVRRSFDIIDRKKIECGCPGLSVAVAVDGKTVWAEGFGYADIENLVPCTPETILRIASISKPIAMVTVAKQVEAGALDLDAPVQKYVPEFPEKTWDGKKVTITTRQLLCHLGGIRDYKKDYFQKKESKSDKNSDCKTSAGDEEFYIMENYKSVVEGLDLFKDDPLVNDPGTKFTYTTHGWTLISAIVEKVASKEKDFVTYLKKVLQDLGMENTYPEYQGPLVSNRGRHYVKDDKGKIINAPYVDLSYKWAGGGLISNVLDIVKFGNAMLYSYQADSLSGADSKNYGNLRLGYLKPETMKMMWTEVEKTDISWEGNPDSGYGLGWAVHPIKDPKPFCATKKFFVYHTGGAVGASSILLILPRSGTPRDAQSSQDLKSSDIPSPRGIVVAIITNIPKVGFINTAYEIANLFERVEF